MPFFFFNDTATTEIYTLSLRDALPISRSPSRPSTGCSPRSTPTTAPAPPSPPAASCRGSSRSEEHTSELQSRQYLVCRLLLEKKKDLKMKRPVSVHPSLTHHTYFTVHF